MKSLTNIFNSKKRLIFAILGLLCTIIIVSVLIINKHEEESPFFGLQQKQFSELNNSVHKAVLAQNSKYAEGEASTEGHVILDVDKEADTFKVYTVSSFGAFSFENGIFTKTSGSGAIPTVITFSKNNNGKFALISYKEPQDGDLYESSVKSLFPEKLQSKVLNAQSYNTNLSNQQESQAKNYLKSINRTAKVSIVDIEKKLPNINVQASNKLFAELAKSDEFISNCPYWIGTREKIENNVRYIYGTSQSKTNDGYDMITFTKTKVDGTVVKQISYKIVGSDIQLVS